MTFKKKLVWLCFITLLALLAYGDGMAVIHTHALGYNVMYSDGENPFTQHSIFFFFISGLIIGDSRFKILDLNDQVFEGNTKYKIRQQDNVPALSNIDSSTIFTLKNSCYGVPDITVVTSNDSSISRSIPGSASVDHAVLKSVTDRRDIHFIDEVTHSHFDCMYNKHRSLALILLNNQHNKNKFLSLHQ